MSHHQNIANVDATLTFTGSVQSLAQILAAFPGGSLTLATVIAADASLSAPAASATAKPAAKTTAKSADAGNADASSGTSVSNPVSSVAAGNPSEPGPSATSTASPSEGNGQTSTGSSNEPDTAGASESAEAVTYEQFAKAFLDLVGKKGRDTAVAIFKPFGVSNGKELKPEQWADAYAAVNKALAA